MPSYNLTGPQLGILTSWLFEQHGYLESAVNSSGQSAWQVLSTTPDLDVTEWIRTNTRAASVDPRAWSETGMVWWMRSNAGVNITPPSRPAETVEWVSCINEWAASIDVALSRVSEAVRNQTTITLTAENGSTSTMPSGAHLVQQRNMFSAILGVLV